MDLTPHVEQLRHELAVAADTGSDETRALAERLTAPLESAARLTLLNALSTAMDEITRDLAPGSVELRLRGLDPQFVVTLPPTSEPYEEPAPAAAPPSFAPPAPVDTDEGNTSRINFRLPAPLKARVEEAASHSGLSVNAWLVRAVAASLAPAGDSAPPPRPVRMGGGSYTGWVH
ncbi:hypothetical protein OG762_47490 (plasmid) [Streptomyces sp. NBC_01136]|uniref:hypothetical protein n=1 Tax=unclassified Streptomyces TaxID=2593676 RepID=UPI002F9185E5|nr:hypothetical protein OG762_47490 [Streptomyces sp. NBC_01136]